MICSFVIVDDYSRRQFHPFRKTEIECENMAYKLKLKQVPKFETPSSGTKVNDVLGEKYGLLKDIGFPER
jgi:hypothetical protein